jgi:peptide chain release factor 1
MMRNICRFYHFRPLTLKLESKLQPYHNKYQEIDAQILKLVAENSPNISQILTGLQRENAYLGPYANIYTRFHKCISELKELDELKALETNEMREAAEAEIAELEEQILGLEEEAIEILIPKSQEDEMSVFLEIRPGVGGSESSLFAENMMEMYTSYSLTKGWSYDVVNLSKDIQLNKGCKEVILHIEGNGAYKKLKYESGVHK